MYQHLSTPGALDFAFVNGDSDIKLFPEGDDNDDGTDADFLVMMLLTRTWMKLPALLCTTLLMIPM